MVRMDSVRFPLWSTYIRVSLEGCVGSSCSAPLTAWQMPTVEKPSIGSFSVHKLRLVEALAGH